MIGIPQRLTVPTYLLLVHDTMTLYAVLYAAFLLFYLTTLYPVFYVSIHFIYSRLNPPSLLANPRANLLFECLAFGVCLFVCFILFFD